MQLPIVARFGVAGAADPGLLFGVLSPRTREALAVPEHQTPSPLWSQRHARPGGLEGMGASHERVTEELDYLRRDVAQRVGFDRVHRVVAAVECLDALGGDAGAPHATAGGVGPAANKPPLLEPSPFGGCEAARLCSHTKVSANVGRHQDGKAQAGCMHLVWQGRRRRELSRFGRCAQLVSRSAASRFVRGRCGRGASSRCLRVRGCGSARRTGRGGRRVP
jgi:hypothetical protein